MYDVIIAGGGVAGVCAAIASARSGAKTLVIERAGCLGGTWTSSLVSWLIDVKNKKGTIVHEITQRLESCGRGRVARGGSFLAEPEAMKVTLDEMCREAGVHIRLYTMVIGAETENGRVTSIKTASKSGIESFSAKYYVDATGDGDLSSLAGAKYSLGNEQGKLQPMTLFALVGGPDYENMVKYDNSLPHTPTNNPKVNLKNEIIRAGLTPSQQDPGMYHLFENVYLLTINQEYGVKGTDANDLTNATIDARGEINRVVKALRELGGIWEKLRLISTAESIGVREGRRILGAYTVTMEDLDNKSRFEDGICNVTFNVDVHALTRDNKTGYEHSNDNILYRDYQIPLRACMVEGFSNLFTAGRCISGDFLAHSSYRVSGNAAVIGEHVGAYAAKRTLGIQNTQKPASVS